MNSYSLAERINSKVNASVQYKTDLEQYSKPEHWVEAGTFGDCELMVAIAKSKLGKPYDYTGILGLGVNRDWQENDMWFCSEDVADTLKRAGLQLTGLLNVHSVFPQTCFDWRHKVLDRSVF